jgi:TatD DNase family protein
MILVDTHCHLQDTRFDGELEAVIAAARQQGVVRMVVCGYDERSNASALAMAAAHDAVVPAVGFHPHEAKTVTQQMLDTLLTLAGRDEVAAVGEIGLDFHYNLSPAADQHRVLDAQLEIALTLGKPVSVHSRAAEAELLEPLRRYAARAAAGRPPGVLHCFGGTLEQALPYVEAGFLVSIACPVTYPRNDEARRLATGLPLEALVVETDSPYLPPQGKRGARNEPANVVAAAVAVARARGISLEDVASATTRNACRLFGIAIPEEVPVW